MESKLYYTRGVVRASRGLSKLAGLLSQIRPSGFTFNQPPCLRRADYGKADANQHDPPKTVHKCIVDCALISDPALEPRPGGISIAASLT